MKRIMLAFASVTILAGSFGIAAATAAPIAPDALHKSAPAMIVQTDMRDDHHMSMHDRMMMHRMEMRHRMEMHRHMMMMHHDHHDNM